MRIWPLSNILDGLIDTVNGIGFFIWDLDAEFLLDGHDDFDGVEAVEAEVVAEV